MFRLCVFIILAFSLNINAQQISKKSAYDVYDRIVEAIGNNNPRSPKLVFKQTERNPASYSPQKKIITIEERVLEICYSFGEDSLDVLSYILAHELGHHYRNHGWMSKYASLEFGNSLDNQNKSPEQRKNYEIESDIFAGFYSHIAGYDALKVADLFLDAIYKSYSLPTNLKNYPHLDERKAIIQQNKNDFEELKNIFDLANILMSLGKYEYAKELYQYIINRGFTSREIFNNLGLCSVYMALDLNVEDAYFNLLIPFKIDLSTRLESNGNTRSFSFSRDQAIILFNEAKREFKTAINLDDSYCLAKENLFFTNVSLTYLGEKPLNKVSRDDLISCVKCCEFCIDGHTAVLENELSKARKIFKKGSNHCSICDINTDFKKSQKPKKNKYLSNVFEVSENINGFDMYCIDFLKSECDKYYKLLDSKICVNYFKDEKLYKLKKKIKGKTSCISIQEINSNKFKNNIDVYNGDNVSVILDNFDDLRVINSAEIMYITVIKEQLTFLIEDDKVKKWYYYEIIN